MTSERQQIEWTAAYAHRVLVRRADIRLSAGAARSPHHQTWVSRKPKSTPQGGERPQATGDRYERHLHSYLKPQASSLEPPGRTRIGTNHLALV